MFISGISALAAAAIALAPAPLVAQPDTLTTADRKRLVQELETSRETFLASINGLSEAQWNFKPAPEKWSIAEVAEHLTLVEQGIGGMLRTSLVPITPFPADSAAKLEAGVRALYGDRTHRMNSPEGFVPTGKWKTQSELLAAFTAARAETLEYVRTSHDSLRARAMPHPAFGQIDGAHVAVLLAAHMNRHVQQIEGVKNSEGYPR